MSRQNKVENIQKYKVTWEHNRTDRVFLSSLGTNDENYDMSSSRNTIQCQFREIVVYFLVRAVQWCIMWAFWTHAQEIPEIFSKDLGLDLWQAKTEHRTNEIIKYHSSLSDPNHRWWPTVVHLFFWLFFLLELMLKIFCQVKHFWMWPVDFYGRGLNKENLKLRNDGAQANLVKPWK